MDLVTQAPDILARALANGGDFAELYLEEKTQTSLRLERGRIERVSSGTDIGAGIRLLYGDLTLYAHTNDISFDGLVKAADTVAAGAHAPKQQYCFEYTPEFFATPVRFRPHEISTEQKVQFAVAADHAARAYNPRVTQVQVM